MESFTCPKCGATSRHPVDITEGYCGRCHEWTGCVFCAIAAGTAPVQEVRAWPDAIAFTPLDPVTDGHTLVIPRLHVPDAITSVDITAATMRRAVELARESQSSNILTSVGKAATQSVWHLHIHVVPRADDDQLMLPWGTTGDPHAPHWCKVAEDLWRQLGQGPVVPAEIKNGCPEAGAPGTSANLASRRKGPAMY